MPRDKQEPVWRKKKVRVSKKSPLPVPIASVSGVLPSQQTWYSYTGYLQGSTVVIKHSGDADFLYRMGFFGKGTLSRSEPNLESRRQKVNIHFPKKIITSEDTSLNLTKVTVTSKRSYLKHLQYRALEEDNESEFNALVEQELMQRYKDGEDEEEEIEEEEEEEEEEADESDSSSPARMARREGYAINRGSGDHQNVVPSELNSQSRSFLISLLARVAQRSKENIATFIRIPLTLYQLEQKFQQMRRQEINVIEKARTNNLSVSKPVSKSGSQDVIDLIDLDETEDVVVLNSDDNSKDSEEQNVDASSKKDDKTSSSWDDPENKGDANYWGMTSSSDSSNTYKKQGNRKRADETMTNSVPETLDKNSVLDPNHKEVHSDETNEMNKNKESPLESEEKDMSSRNKEICSDQKEISENGDNKNEPHVSDDTETQSSSKKSVFEDALVLDKDENYAGNTNKGDHSINSSSGNIKEKVNLVKKSKERSSPAKMIFEDGANALDNQNNSQKFSLLSQSKGEDSDDSDDVICIEAESAEPEKLHTFLSQAPSDQKQPVQIPTISKSVRFMTNISKEPKFVNAKVAFRSWTDILHFNFSGDKDHLPTALEVLPDSQRNDARQVQNHNLNGDVYERLYPPVDSLVTRLESKGVVVKQRLEEIPSLDAVIRNVLHATTENTHMPSSSNSQSLQVQLPHSTSPKPVGSLERHSDLSSRQQKSDFLESEKAEALSLNSSLFGQYFQIFHRDSTVSSADKCDKDIENRNGKDVEVDECLVSIHKEIDKLKSQQTEFEKENTLKKDSEVFRFNCLLSEYLTKLGISLTKELVMLKILVCGSEISCQIPEDFLAKTKSSLSQEEKRFLFERLEFVLSCLTPDPSPDSALNSSDEKNNSNDVIMIDLSDEESDKDKSDNNDAKKQVNSHVERQQSGSNEGGSRESALSEIDNSTSLEKSNISENSVTGADKDICSEEENVSSGRKRSRHDSEKDKSDSKRAKLNSHSNKDDVSKISDTDSDNTLATAAHCNQESKQLKSNGVDAKLNKKESEQSCDSNIQCKDIEPNNDKHDIQKGETIEKEKDTPSDLPSHSVNEEGLDKIRSAKDDYKNDEEISITKDEPKKENLKSSNEVPEASTSNSHSHSFVEKDETSSTKTQESSKSKDGKVETDVVIENDEIYIGSSDDEEEGKNNQSWFGAFQTQTRDHPYSIKDNLRGDLFVIPNTSDEDDEDDSPVNSFKWQPCVKKDPYPPAERLHLLLEEAFFLTFGLGCLTVLDSEKKPMTITEMWQQFPALKDNFLPHYVAYHYFRSKGWVPKSGLKFGCDFVLYREGPPFFHGSYSVVVVAVREGTLTPMIGDDGGLDFPQRLNTWITLSGLNRATEHVAKELMYCYVICPKGLTEEESKSPKCISRFRVKEVVVSRWVSSKERDSKEKEEMP